MIEFIKRNTRLDLIPARNKLGDLVIGWNRPALNKDERITLDVADEWLPEDIEKARKAVARYALDKSEPAVFIAFYIGQRRWPEASGFFELLKTGQAAKAALVISNSKWFRNNPALGCYLAKKIAQGEKTL